MVAFPEFRGVSHGKVILIGEHSAVYGYPAIVLPLFEAQLSAVVTPREDTKVSIDCEYFTGDLDQAPEMLNNIRTLVSRLRYDFSLENKGFHIEITSNIPHERGMGSSAAVAVAVVRALAKFTGHALSFTQEFEYAQISENIAHLNASGMDSASVAAHGAVWFKRDEEISRFAFDTSGVIVVADTGVQGCTKEAVSSVRALLQSQNENVSRETAGHINRLGQLAFDCAQALRTGSLKVLGRCLNEAHRILSALQVSSVELDHLVEVARSAGALGAKLTGGGRGGCMVALAENAQVARTMSAQLRQAGAIHTWSVPLLSKGA
ncbi:mevalonate kinase [Alloscardovia criceti]|uniref:mevalonate kinase n=1 Tax=Alloscardovia criceti TaxID=356828 RepID=UPI00036581A9|nr:mevalonate kinase [Alloscardovia criceti]